MSTSVASPQANAKVKAPQKTSVLTKFKTLQKAMNQAIIGQPKFVHRLIIALLADGHLIVEGAPGLAKTTAIKAMSDNIEGDFQRIQFTPDLLPSDITGTDIYSAKTETFNFQKGPIFHHFVLADEINRAPAKVQAALLEAMAEGQISVGNQTYRLPEFFIVMATQNPIEQEGTFPLPEAQLDRFLLHVSIDYPDAAAEKAILRASDLPKNAEAKLNAQISQKDIFQARAEIAKVKVPEAVEDYMIALILATREPEKYGCDIQAFLEYGASPRATIGLKNCAKAVSWMAGRNFVTPDDVQAILPEILKHRLGLSYSATAQNITPEMIVNKLISSVAAP